MNQPELGKLIAQKRFEHKLTQNDLANKCGVNLRTIQRIESGDVMPRLYTLNIISDVLNHNFEYIPNYVKPNFLNRTAEFIVRNFCIPKVSIIFISINFIGMLLAFISDDFQELFSFTTKNDLLSSRFYTVLTYSIIHIGLQHWFFLSVFILILGSFVEKWVSVKKVILLLISAQLIWPIFVSFTIDERIFLVGSKSYIPALFGASLAIIISQKITSKIVKVPIYLLLTMYLWSTILENSSLSRIMILSELLILVYGFLVSYLTFWKRK